MMVEYAENEREEKKKETQKKNNTRGKRRHLSNAPDDDLHSNEREKAQIANGKPKRREHIVVRKHE